MKFTLTEIETRIFNLRKELARQLWKARKGTLDVFEAYENSRDLVALFPDEYIEIADKLQHDVSKQMTRIFGKIQLARKGLDHSSITKPSLKTRPILKAVRLSPNMIG